MPDFLGIAQKLEKGTPLARALNGVAAREKEPWKRVLRDLARSVKTEPLAAGLDAGIEPATLFRSARFFAQGEEIRAYSSEAAEAIEQGADPLELFLGHPSFRFEGAEDLDAVRGLLLARAETLERSLLAFLKKRMVEPIALILLVTVMLGQARLLPFAERHAEQAEQAEQHLEEMSP